MANSQRTTLVVDGIRIAYCCSSDSYAPAFEEPVIVRVGATEEQKTAYCEWCHCITLHDSRGYCASCGGPRKVIYDD